MADTRRTTNVIQRWRLGFTRGALSDYSAESVCQGGAGAKIAIALPTNGQEVFLPPLDPHRVYQLTVRGICTYWKDIGILSRWETAVREDALYEADGLGNFLKPHDWLRLDGVPLRWVLENAVAEAMPEEDREAHRYSLRMDGRAKKISARFCIQEKRTVRTDGALMLTVELLPEGTPSPAAARWTAQAAKEKARLETKAAKERARLETKTAQEKAERDEQAAREHAAHKAKLEALRLQAHRESHLLDPEFQQQYARHNPKTILSELKSDWSREYDQFMHNAELKQLVAEQAPQVLEWLEARVKIVQLAERLMVTPPSLPPRKKMTADEVRARIIRRQGVRVDDGIALTKLKAEKIAEAKAMLDSLGLDSEERERLETELIQDILEAGEDENNAKGGTTL